MEKIILAKEWYKVTEVEELTGIQRLTINYKIRNKEITNVKFERNLNLIPKNEVLRLIKEVEAGNQAHKDYYTISETAKILHKTEKSVRNMIHRKAFKTATRINRTHYITKEEVHSLEKYFCNTLRSHEVCELYGLIRQDVQYMCENKLVEAGCLNGIWYINEKSIKDFIEDTKEKFNLVDSKNITRRHLEASVNGVVGITVKEASERFGTSPTTIRHHIKDGIVSAQQIGSIYYIKESDLDKLFNSFEGIKKKYFYSDDVHTMYSELMNFIVNSNMNTQETIKIFRTWGMEKLNRSKSNSKNRKVAVLRYCNTAQCIAQHAEKEIWDWNEDELECVRKNIKSQTNQAILYQFISHVNEIQNSQIDIARYNVIKVDNKNKTTNEKEKYTEDEWLSLRNYLIDIDIHIKKAIKDKLYAQSWLYMIWHLSLAWRSDTFLQMPAIDVEEILSCDLENMDFRELTMTDCQRIVNRIIKSCKPIIANKNGVQTHMTVVPAHLKATAIAICISELHRKKEKDKWTKMFFYKRMKNNVVSRILPTGIPSFHSRRANKSKMTYSYITAMNKRGRSHLALKFQRYARSHKIKMSGVNGVTATYIELTNTTGDAKAISKHLFDRGVFGWQIELMLGLIEDNSDDSLITRTKRIQALRKEFSPIVVEGMSNYLVTMSKQADELVEELIKLDEKELHRKLMKLAEFKSPGLLKNTQCIKEVENCPYEGDEHCLGCKYNVPTNYVLESVNIKLNEAIELLSNTDYEDAFERIKYTYLIRKMLFILMDFRRSAKELGNDYIKSFIDLKSLQEKISFLQETKYLSAGDGENGN